MLKQIKEFFNYSAEKGLRLPFAYDPIIKKPSVTLFFAHISFYIAVISLISLHFKSSLITATGMSFVFTGMMIIFYLIRSISKAKIDLDDKQIDLESGENKQNEK